ncbi:MAG: IS4 family transposase [Phycisphaerae bacterium]
MAKLGGYIGRRSDGPPGWLTIWRGWQRLLLLVEGFRLAADG